MPSETISTDDDTHQGVQRWRSGQVGALEKLERGRYDGAFARLEEEASSHRRVDGHRIPLWYHASHVTATIVTSVATSSIVWIAARVLGVVLRHRPPRSSQHQEMQELALVVPDSTFYRAAGRQRILHDEDFFGWLYL